MIDLVLPISDERLAEIVGAGVPCVPIEPWEVAHVVQELRSIRAQGGVYSPEASPAPVSEEIEADRARLIHILVVHFDMFRAKAEEAADLFLHHKTLAAKGGQ